MHLLTTHLLWLWLLAAPQWPHFPPIHAEQWEPVKPAKAAPKGAAQCGLPQVPKTAYPTHVPRAFWVVQNPMFSRDSKTGFLSPYAKVFLLKPGSPCVEVLTCNVVGDGGQGSVSEVRKNAQNIFLFYCTGEADNARFYQAQIDGEKTAVNEGPAIGNLDVEDPWTGNPTH